MPASSDIRVLIVDDDARFAMALTALLESEGLTVVGYATNGAEGVELAREARPSVVTMDLEMPVMDGIEATKAIVALGIPVVILSGSQGRDKLGAALAVGASAAVLKSEATRMLVPLLRAVVH
jgi:DNA-binding NarL/FixJ family response regulator